MKVSILFVFIVVWCDSVTAFAQAKTDVISVFKKMYPQAQLSSVKQKKDLYLASFTNDGKKCKALFTKEGEWQQTTIQLKWKMMPPQVRIGLNRTEFSGWQIFDTKEIIRKDTTYAFEVNNENVLDREHAIAMNEDYYVYFNTKGDFIKEEKVY